MKIKDVDYSAFKNAGQPISFMAKNVYRAFKDGYAVVYYGEKGHWLYRGRKFEGSPLDFVTWLRG